MKARLKACLVKIYVLLDTYYINTHMLRAKRNSRKLYLNIKCTPNLVIVSVRTVFTIYHLVTQKVTIESRTQINKFKIYRMGHGNRDKNRQVFLNVECE